MTKIFNLKIQFVAVLKMKKLYFKSNDLILNHQNS